MKTCLLVVGAQVCLVVVFLVMITYTLEDRSWYKPVVKPEDPEELEVDCDDNATTFLFTNFQYIIAAVAFSSSEPFRNTLYSNCKLALHSDYSLSLFGILIFFPLL